MRLSENPLLSEIQIQSRVRELANEINSAYEGKPLLVLVVLKGAAFFAADLLKHLRLDVTVDFVRARSYAGDSSTGQVEFQVWPDTEMTGRNILLLEDILDTGQTCQAILEKLANEEPATVEICTLLDKPARRSQDIHARHVGFTIEDKFVVGYGMDYDEKHRNLNSIFLLEPDTATG